MSKRLRPRHSTAGFTLIEVLVVILIIGILYAIAAPGWEAILSRQRVASTREQVAQVLKQTQVEARNTRTPRVIRFDNNNDVPRFATSAYLGAGSLPTNWQEFGNGGLSAGTVRLSTSGGGAGAGAIIFDSNGAIAQSPAQTLPFTITVEKAGNQPIVGTKRCVKVQSLLGAVQFADGATCDQ